MKMVMYPSGNIKLLEVVNEDFHLHVLGNDIDKVTKNRKINTNIPATIKIRTDKLVILRTLIDNGDLAENNSNLMKPVFFEDGNYEIVLDSSLDFKDYLIIQNGVDISHYFKNIGPVILGSIKFRSDVGYSNIDIYLDGKKLISMLIEVFPSKMDYQKDYINMIGEINEEIASIAFKLLDKTYLKSNLVDRKLQTRTEFINILDHVFKGFEESIKFIVENFKHNIVEIEEVVPIHKAKKISRKTVKHIRTNPDLLLKNSRGFVSIRGERYVPREVVERKKITTVNIFENQFTKYLIKDVIMKIEMQEKMILKVDGYRYYEKVQSKYRLGEKKEKLTAYLRNYFYNISDIAPKNTMSLVFKMSTGYREFYKKYKMLSKGLDLGSDLFKITPKKIYEIYEMWCYLKIHKILFDLGYEVKSYGIIEEKNNSLKLKFDRQSESSLTYEKDNKFLKLWYNKTYSVPTINQRPDTILCIKNLSSDQERTYIFDSKYRLQVDEYGNESPLEQDINIMHRYRDAIVSQLDDGFKYKYETFGAYVMFPCSDEIRFKENRFYKSIEKTNIGAFPMLPGSTGLMTAFLKKILGQSDLEAKEDRLVLDEIDDYYKFKKEDVMVVNSKDREHLETYLEHKFYHIPKKHLTNVRLGVEYIAFYQPKSTFGDSGGIIYYGKIKDIVEYKRKDCMELPSYDSSKNEELYLRFNLERIDKISKISPIQISPIIISYTTLYLLKNAENMHELKIKNNLEMRVYKIMKFISQESTYKPYKNKDVYELGPMEIEIIEGRKIRLDGKEVRLEELKGLILNKIKH